MKGTKILVLEDEYISALSLKLDLEKQGYKIMGPFGRGEDAVACAAETPPDFMLVDVFLAGNMDGIAATEEIRKKVSVPVLFVTASSDPETLQRMSRVSDSGMLHKPYNTAALLEKIKIRLQ